MAALEQNQRRDITNEIAHFCRGIKDEKIKGKLLTSMRHIEEMDLQLMYKSENPFGYEGKGINRQIQILDHGDEIGHFDVDVLKKDGTGNKYTLGISTTSKEGDTDMYNGKGFARLMIAAMVHKLQEEKEFNPSNLCYIDTDASDGFWKAMGMTENPDAEDVGLPQSGYEMQITFEKMAEFALGKRVGGKKSKRRYKNKNKLYGSVRRRARSRLR